MDLEFFPAVHNGHQLVLIRDHLGLTPEGTAVQVPLYQFLTLLDGTRSVVDLQTILMRERGGALVSSEEISGLLSHLDASFLLNSAVFRRKKQEIVDRFYREPVRRARFAGKSYPGEPDALKNRMNEIMSTAPGTLPEPGTATRALVAPHIDLSVGYRSYARAYGVLKDARPSRVIVLGTGHQLAEGLFSLTEKDFETPFGTVPNDREAVRALRAAGSECVAPDDFVHRSEHSIEFQLIFLQHSLIEKPFTIIPILCGSLQLGLPTYSRQSFQETAAPFLNALKELLFDTGHDTIVVAGVDFSHTGPKFGHSSTARQMEPRFQAHDQTLLEHLCKMDADGFWKESAREKDQYHVCGFSALACLLEVLPEARGTVLDYDIWHEEPTQSAVSFASVAFEEQI